jgi:translation initiation factor 2B subunit (eIF-2B alpha/beta/delta family)
MLLWYLTVNSWMIFFCALAGSAHIISRARHATSPMMVCILPRKLHSKTCERAHPEINLKPGMVQIEILQMNPKPASMFAFSRPSCKTDAMC